MLTLLPVMSATSVPLMTMNPYLIMLEAARPLSPLNNPQCKQQMLDWIKARWMKDVYPCLMQHQPFLLYSWGQIQPVFFSLSGTWRWLLSIMMRRHFFGRLRQEDSFSFSASQLLWDFPFFFPRLSFTSSARICLWLLLSHPPLFLLSQHAFTGLIHSEPFRWI